MVQNQSARQNTASYLNTAECQSQVLLMDRRNCFESWAPLPKNCWRVCTLIWQTIEHARPVGDECGRAGFPFRCSYQTSLMLISIPSTPRIIE